jgi:predicted acyltransferase
LEPASNPDHSSERARDDASKDRTSDVHGDSRRSLNDSETVEVKRLASVDALRGFDMFWIIGGRELVLAVAALMVTPVPQWLDLQLRHVPWEGFVSWDLIMPLFLFVSGVALPFSAKKWHASRDGRKGFYLRVARRLVILWILGMAIQGDLLAFDIDQLRLYSNTLQAIAAGYLVSVIFLRTLSITAQAIATAGLLVGYWAILMFVPIPGVGAGILEPWNNYALYFDRLVLGRFTDTTNYTWVLSSLGFASTLMMGVFAGHILGSKASQPRKFVMLLSMGFGCLAAGWLWSFSFPIIKHIWTSSMSLWAGGWSYLLLAAFYWVIDMRGWRKWAFPLIVIGTNAIFAYVAVHLIDLHHVFEYCIRKLTPWTGSLSALLSNGGALLALWLVLLAMYKKRIFLRL